jgi:hypothetical protein
MTASELEAGRKAYEAEMAAYAAWYKREVLGL